MVLKFHLWKIEMMNGMVANGNGCQFVCQWTSDKKKKTVIHKKHKNYMKIDRLHAIYFCIDENFKE